MSVTASRVVRSTLRLHQVSRFVAVGGTSSSTISTVLTDTKSSSVGYTTNNGQHQQQCRRWLGTGTRGARGHGWYVNYRAGKGGRHLQGEYHDRESLEQCEAWNDAVLQLGSTRTWLDVVVEPRQRSDLTRTKQKVDIPPLDELSGPTHRLTIDIASTVMPETTQNFIQLLLADENGYKGTSLYRVEKKVGICGGDVLTNTGKTGKAANGTPLTITIQKDPLAMWHIPGTVTMLVPKVGQIDSRFMLCTELAQHIDGICRAFGRLTPESLAIVSKWHNTLMTRTGIPSALDLIVTGCGVLLEQKGVQEEGTADSHHEGSNEMVTKEAGGKTEAAPSDSGAKQVVTEST